MTSSSTAPSSAEALPSIAGDKDDGIKAFGWVHDPGRRFYFSTWVAYIYSTGGQDFHYSVDVIVTEDEIDLYGKHEIDSLVASRSNAARERIVGVRRATRRKYGINRHSRV